MLREERVFLKCMSSLTLSYFLTCELIVTSKTSIETNRSLCRIKGTDFKVIMETEEQVEVSFSRPWDPSLKGKLVPINIDKRLFLKLYSVIRILFGS